ncbi:MULTISPECIES: YbjN domain-containing protein [unclassified Brevundimonas]|uniref:YbjN domain-containing protein n=1 Tax=unclassified Brevundimonas TaxID=2622653 RepID=UPI003F8EDCAC
MTAAFSALALAVALAASPTPTLAQASVAQPSAAPAPTPAGLPVAAVVDWLKTQGLSVGQVQGGTEPYVQVRESGDLAWTITFNSCENLVCGDLQFSAGFSNPQVTLDKVNGWNAERRFAKAFYEAPSAGRADGAAIFQQDVMLLNGIGPSQLTDSVAVWRSLLPAFALHVGYFTPGAAPAD